VLMTPDPLRFRAYSKHISGRVCTASFPLDLRPALTMARLFMPASLISLFALSLSSTAASTAQHAAACTALSHRISELIPGHAVYNVVNQLLPASSSFLNGTFDYAAPVRALPELCQFGAYFNTSAKSSVKFEVWMPTTTWNGRFAFVGNGIAVCLDGVSGRTLADC
jgi:hypothetical protein